MKIRNAIYRDAPAIKILLENLGYQTRISLLVEQLETIAASQDHEAIVYETPSEIAGFASFHYLPQLAFDGGLLIISYFAVADEPINKPIAEILERYITDRARYRRCERIQVHCQEWRVPAHQFYLQRGYQEYPKYFTKRLVYAE